MLDHLVGIANSDLIVPPEVIEMYGDMEDWKNACGTGPFMLVDYVPANSLTLDRNPSYWGYDELHPENRLPYFDQVRMLIIPDNSTRLAAIRTGKIDVLTEVPSLTWEQKETLEQSNPELKWGRHLDMGRGLQCRNDREPFDDVRVRKALRMAIDNKEIAETYYGGNAYWFTTPGLGAGSPYYTQFEDYPEEVQEGYIYNPEKAKALLAEAGYPSGFKTDIVMHSGEPVDLIEVVKAYWAEIGVDLEINVVDYAARTAILYGRKYDQIALSWEGGSGEPVFALKWYYKEVPWNFTCTDDPVFNKMIDDIELEPDPIKRGQMIREANEYTAAQHFGIGLPMAYSYDAFQPWLGGHSGETNLGGFNRGGVFARIWIDQELKDIMMGR